MKNNGALKSKICLITGASKGIGRAIAERFAIEGAIVYANGRESGSIDDWAKMCSQNNNTLVIPIYFDVTNYEQAKAAVMQIKKDHQKIDVLVNNAGMVTYEMLGLIDSVKIREMMEVNVVAVIQMIQAVTRIMMRQKSGSIINISSITATKGAKGQVAYSATKGALLSLTKSAAKELAGSNIRINAIAPGMVATERFIEVLETKFKDKITYIGMGRLATPGEIADACLFFASDSSAYITGQILEVDGSTII